MTISAPTVEAPRCWLLEALPGDGLLASSSHHLILVELEDEVSSTSGVADELIAAFESHSRLTGAVAGRSLRLAIATVLSRHPTTMCTAAVLSAWEDRLAISLYGSAVAVLQHQRRATTLSGEQSLVATDLVVRNDLDELRLEAGAPPDDGLVPVELGDVVTGRGVRITWPTTGRAVLNEWGADLR